ncbi:MAG: ABC transporter permease [Ilumatobacteraceae bacterium]
MSWLQAAWLVAGRELRESFRRKTTWVIIAVLLIGSTAAMVVPELVSSDGPTGYDVAVVGDATSFGPTLIALGPAFNAAISITPVADAATARARVDHGDSAVGVALGADPSIIVRSGEHERLVGAASQALAATGLAEALVTAGLTDQEVQRVLDVPPPRLEELAKEAESRRAASFALSLVLYLLLLTVMIQVANGVAIEKANRISEVLLAVVRPGPLLFGKIIGVGLGGIAIMLTALAPPVAKLAVGGDLPAGLSGALAGSVIWFVLGLALYLTIAGSLGALVERQEEAGSAIAPLTGLLVGSFIIAQSSPESPLGTVLAYVPLTSPLMVPTRVAIGVSSPVELVISGVLLLLAIAAVARVGSHVYARAVVHTGRRLKLRDMMGSAERRRAGPSRVE